VYRWYTPSGPAAAREDFAPRPALLPHLPPAWVRGLAEAATQAAPAAADTASGYALLDVLLADERQPCVEVTSAALTARAQLSAAGTGGRHDTATARVHHLVQLGAAGHPGVGPVLGEVRELWAQLTAGEDRETEFERMLLGSARKAVTAIAATRPVGRDPCLVADGAGWQPPTETPPYPVAAGPWSLREAISAHAFDPATDQDQGIADAILRRMVPGLRYACDAGAWLIRRQDRWDLAKDLAPSAVAIVAELMPPGNPQAERGSQDRRRADRRKRLMSAAGAALVAAKVRALATAGNHPCAIRLGDLDTDPDVLWAGGTAWDLRASADRPVPAGVDAATPHLHAVPFAPDPGRPTPLWEAFLAAVWPDAGVRAWALRVLSIAVTGYPSAALPILLGPTRRGKSQLVALLMSVLGSYAHAADPRLLAGTENAHASIVYELKGRRLSFIDEGPRRGVVAQERLKQLTGGAALTGNPMRKNPVTFTPTHTLVLTANPEAEITLTDPAIRARVRLIPCEGDEHAVRTARDRIGPLSMPTWQAEAPGVLAQMMREAARWLADPASADTTASPGCIRGLAEEIAEEQDPVRVWLDTAVVPDETGTGSTELYQAFITWCRNMDIQRPPTLTRWGRDLNDAGHPAVKRAGGMRFRPLRPRIPGGWAPLLPVSPNGQAVPGTV
jgi:P4 family phage/plasmid primase-like protien